MIDTKIGYAYNDLTIVPNVISSITTRKECNPFLDDETLPIFTAPMSTVVNEKNLKLWRKNHIIPIIPRNIDLKQRANIYMRNGEWVALSLSEFETLWCNISETDAGPFLKGKTFRVCIDLANGHMLSLYETINKAKECSEKFDYNLIIMTGNIANPETYKWICEHAKVDYIRLGIGSGAGCTTSSNTGVHYPMASLIDACINIRKQAQREIDMEKEGNWTDSHGYPYKASYMSSPKIIADGGIRNYCDVNKALALGADCVMIGGLFASLFESAAPFDSYVNDFANGYNPETGDVTLTDGKVINIWSETSSENDKHFLLKSVFETPVKIFFGMSTKKAQQQINENAKLKTSEGCIKKYTVTHTLAQWSENMIDYLKSAMSYCGCKTLNQFIGNVTLKVNSPAEINAVNK